MPALAVPPSSCGIQYPIRKQIPEQISHPLQDITHQCILALLPISTAKDFGFPVTTSQSSSFTYT